jgi:predicted Zn-ribbon and HTH transcriptional regulator
VPGYIRKGQKIYHHEEYAEESSRAGKVIVAVDCPNCGANFKGVSGEPSQCPYCGSYINVK